MAEVYRNLNGILGNGTISNQAPIIVRAEEALIVVLVLALWIAAIALFFNRWGKIRMLEPYQPKFTQQHRTSCSLVDQTLIQPRSMSKFNLSGENVFNQQNLIRPRQNSVFVGSSMTFLPVNAPRKVKSAFDLKNLMLSDPALNKGVTPASARSKVNFGEDRFRRQSWLSPFPRIEHWQTETFQKCKERRLSFKDLVEMEKIQKCERVLCYLEKEPAECDLSKKGKRMAEKKQRRQSSMADSRHNSIANADQKSISGKFQNSERKNSSQFPAEKEISSALPIDPEGNDETRPDFRRNSSILFNPVETDRNFLNPRDSIKSGVVDFRRNSLMIINSLTEDVGYRSFRRDYPLGGSIAALGPDFSAVPGRRYSAMNLPFGVEVKQKAVPGHGSHAKAKHASRNDCLHNSALGKIRLSRKPSKSLDCGEPTNNYVWQGKTDETEVKTKYLAPGEPRSFAGSSASLNVSFPRPEMRPMEESRSAGAINSFGQETDREDPGKSDKSEAKDFRSRTASAIARETFFREKEPEMESVPTVNVTMFGPIPNSNGSEADKISQV